MNYQPEREEVFKCLTDCPAYQTYEAFNKFVKCDGRKELYGLLRDINDKISIHRSSNMNSGEEITRRGSGSSRGVEKDTIV